jgi:hypothetical protein
MRWLHARKKLTNRQFVQDHRALSRSAELLLPIGKNPLKLNLIERAGADVYPLKSS